MMESVLDPMGMCGARGVRLNPGGASMGMGMCGVGGVELHSTSAGLHDTGRVGLNPGDGGGCAWGTTVVRTVVGC